MRRRPADGGQHGEHVVVEPPDPGQHGLGERCPCAPRRAPRRRTGCRPPARAARARATRERAARRARRAGAPRPRGQRRQLDPAHERPPRQLGREPAQLAERARRRRGRWPARPAAPRAGCGPRKASSASVERSAHWMSSSTSRTGPCVVRRSGRAARAAARRAGRPERRAPVAARGSTAASAPRASSVSASSCAEPVGREPAQRGDDRRVGQRLAAELDALAVQHAGSPTRSTSATSRVLPMPASPESRTTAGGAASASSQRAQRRVTPDQRPVRHTAIISDRCRMWAASGYARQRDRRSRRRPDRLADRPRRPDRARARRRGAHARRADDVLPDQPPLAARGRGGGADRARRAPAVRAGPGGRDRQPQRLDAARARRRRGRGDRARPPCGHRRGLRRDPVRAGVLRGRPLHARRHPLRGRRPGGGDRVRA